MFGELERDGVITTMVGSGSYIADSAIRNPTVLKKAEAGLTEALRQARSAGITKEEAMEMVQKLYEEEMK